MHVGTGTGQSHDCLQPPWTHSPSPPRCPLTFVGVGEPDLGGAGVGPAEGRFWGGGGGAGGVAGPPRAQAATQEAPHERGGGGTPHQAAAGCRERARSGGLGTVRGASPGHTQPPCTHSPRATRVTRVSVTFVHTQPLCTHMPRAHTPHVTLPLVHIPCEHPRPLCGHTPHACTSSHPQPHGAQTRSRACEARQSRARGTRALPCVCPKHTHVCQHTGGFAHACGSPRCCSPPGDTGCSQCQDNPKLQGHGLCHAVFVCVRTCV